MRGVVSHLCPLSASHWLQAVPWGGDMLFSSRINVKRRGHTGSPSAEKTQGRWGLGAPSR